MYYHHVRTASTRSQRAESEPGRGQTWADPPVATSLADEIAFRVESAIVEGLYPPGSRLPQDELCDRFGVSRTPVREALRKLQARNVVVVIPNKGATTMPWPSPTSAIAGAKVSVVSDR